MIWKRSLGSDAAAEAWPLESAATVRPAESAPMSVGALPVAGSLADSASVRCEGATEASC
jgi:hypothetical protein